MILYDIIFKIENRYYSDGCICFNAEEFTGYLTNDRIKGEFRNSSLIIYLETLDLLLQEKEKFSFYLPLDDDFELPGEYNLSPADSHESYAMIKFVQKSSKTLPEFTKIMSM